MHSSLSGACCWLRQGLHGVFLLRWISAGWADCSTFLLLAGGGRRRCLRRGCAGACAPWPPRGRTDPAALPEQHRSIATDVLVVVKRAGPLR